MQILKYIEETDKATNTSSIEKNTDRDYLKMNLQCLGISFSAVTNRRENVERQDMSEQSIWYLCLNLMMNCCKARE